MLRLATSTSTMWARGLASASRRPLPHRVHPQWTSPPPQHELWKPNSWLGAYYGIREDKGSAATKQQQLVGKKTTRRGRFIVGAMNSIEKSKRVEAEPWRAMRWQPGSYLEIDHVPRTGSAVERVVGMLLGVKRKGLGSTFRLLCHVEGATVEYQYQTFSPLLVNATVRRAPDHKHVLAQVLKTKEAHKLSFPRARRLEKRKEAEVVDPSKFSGRTRGEQR